MSICGCNFKCSCTAAALVISLLVGVIGAFLQITAAFTLTPAVYGVLLGIAVVYLGLLIITGGRMQLCSCGCTALSALLLGILGTILFAGILLAVTFAATSILGAVIVGLLLASFTLVLTSAACLVWAVNNCEA